MEINNPLNLPEDYMKAIGSATAVLSAYECMLEMLIWELLGLGALGADDFRCEAITTNMSFSQKIHAIGALTEVIHLKKEFTRLTYRKIKKVISDANSISKERNKIIHGLWNRDPDNENGTFLSSVSAYGKLKFFKRYENISDLNKFIKKVDKSGARLWALRSDIITCLTPMPG